jgi:hypothetical protein
MICEPSWLYSHMSNGMLVFIIFFKWRGNQLVVWVALLKRIGGFDCEIEWYFRFPVIRHLQSVRSILYWIRVKIKKVYGVWGSEYKDSLKKNFKV